MAEQRCSKHQPGDADEPVDDAGGGIRLAELHTEDLSDEVEAGKGNEFPVERADDGQRSGKLRIVDFMMGSCRVVGSG